MKARWRRPISGMKWYRQAKKDFAELARGVVMEDFPDVDAYLEASDQWPDEIKVLRPLLLDCGLTEEIKWGKPCYCLEDANIVLIQEFSDHLGTHVLQGRAPRRPRQACSTTRDRTHTQRNASSSLRSATSRRWPTW